ncbi:molecular chaperone Hsp33 [Marinosulfonomonas sp. PRT-SC04]|nr:molecular chaperone Hsp33 [Marinosulfonomonas sp. PRT-SC04]
MTESTKITWDDTVLPFQLDRANIRGRVARLDGVLENVLKQHNYPPQIEALIAEVALLTALIGQTIKLRWKLSIQIRGDGAARILAADFYAPETEGAPARIRAYASFDPDRLDSTQTPFSQIGKGFFAILIDQGSGTEPYQGVTPLDKTSLSACAETYFDQSEQIPTRFELAFGRSQMAGEQARWRAGGMMLQHMPNASPLMVGASAPIVLADDDNGENWTRANILLDTVDQIELIGPTVAPADLLLRLFHEEQPRIFGPQPVSFGCTCSEDRVRQSLSIYSAKDISSMITDDGIVTADCQFCGTHYKFDPKTLGFEAIEQVDGKGE